jgi:hypothetical protein
MIQRSESIKELATALSKFQGEITPAPKDSTNPFFKSKYSDIATIIEHAKPVLVKNGLALSQLPSNDGDLVNVTTLLLHTSGEWLSSTLSMKPVKVDPQAIGSCITYIRRYSLAILGIVTEEDDDGNSATHEHEPTPKKSGVNAPPTKKLSDLYYALRDILEELTTESDYNSVLIQIKGFKEDKKLSEQELSQLRTLSEKTKTRLGL